MEKYFCMVCGTELDLTDSCCKHCGAKIMDIEGTNEDESITYSWNHECFDKWIQITRKKTGESFYFNDAERIIGRSKDAHCCICDNPHIGRMHVKIFQSDGEFFAEDLNSMNHTFINGRMIKKPEKIYSGDVIRLADEDFDICIEE